MENKEKKTKHTRLKYADRIEIQRLIEEGCTKTEIAEKIGVHFSTIYREIIRGGTPYSADEAQRRLTESNRMNNESQICFIAAPTIVSFVEGSGI